ncbi:MAG TPA: hypothetical protein VMM84_15105 [Pyrinomonadaceae bacterium]|nr:hypothetical protein [Pyrinomonadaceae bacterium]
MKSNDRETLFLRYKDQLVSIKTISGGIYEGRLLEITDDYVTLIEDEKTEPARVFLFFNAIESMAVAEIPES